MPTITQLEYILAVSKTKHFGKASDHCNVSQPSLSMQIQKAEDELGIQIFDRNQKPIGLTEKGKLVVEQAQNMINEYQKLLRVSREENDQVKGDFKLGVIPTLSSSVIPLFVREFSDRFPLVNLYINELTTENIISALKMDDIDGAILATPLNENSIVEMKLFYEPFSVYCSPGHPLLDQRQLKVDDLLRQNDLWILSDGHCFKNQVLNFCGVSEELQVFSNIHFQSGSLDTLKQLVRKGGGYTFLPQLYVDQLSTAEKKQIREFKQPVPSREVSLVYRKSHWKQDILQALHTTIQATQPSSVKKSRASQMDVIDIESKYEA